MSQSWTCFFLFFNVNFFFWQENSLGLGSGHKQTAQTSRVAVIRLYCCYAYAMKEGVIFLPGVFLNEDDYNFDIALRRFKKQVEKAGVLSEMKKRQHYEKPSVMRKKKKAAARKRLLKKMRKINLG